MPIQYQLIYFITAFLNATIALGVFFRRSRERLVQAFVGFGLSITAWVVTLYLFYIFSDSVSVIMIGRLNFVFSTCMAYFALLFAYLFPEPVVKFRRSWHALLAGSSALLAVLTLTTDLVDRNEVVHGISRSTEYGPLYGLFVAHFVALCVGSIVLLAYKYRKLKGPARRQIAFFASGWTFGFVWGTVTNIIIPAVTGYYDVQHLGPIAALAFVAVTAYAVARQELLNVELIGVETFIVLLLVLFIANIALSPTPTHAAINTLSLVLVMFLSYALYGAVRREVERGKELRRLTLQLRDANDHLKEADKVKSEFISIASHQLRTPITVIKGYLSLMLEGAYGPIGDSLRDKIENMNAMNERLVQMVNNMLNVTRIERNRIEFACTEIDVLPLVREVVEEFSLKARQKGVMLTSALPEGEMVMAFVDSEKIQEVLSNLVDNAIKYTPKGSIEVAVRRLPKKKEVLVTVKDTGLGMDKGAASHAFQKFYRSKDPSVLRETGTGLGLYICAMFVRGMGGDIWIEKTEAGQGTTIAFRMPTVAGGQCLPKERRSLA